MATAGPSHITPNPPLNARSNRVADEGVAVMEDEPHDIHVRNLFDMTLRLLNGRAFQSADPRTFKGLKKRLEIMRDAGLPRMKLLPGKVLEELGRIPRSTELRDDGEPYTVDALEIIEQEMIEREEKGEGKGLRHVDLIKAASKLQHVAPEGRWVGLGRVGGSQAGGWALCWDARQRVQRQGAGSHRVDEVDQVEDRTPQCTFG